jgi:hypothetical protein
VDLAKIIPCKIHGGLSQSFYQDVAKLLADRIRLCGDRVPVVTGISRFLETYFISELIDFYRVFWGCSWRAA